MVARKRKESDSNEPSAGHQAGWAGLMGATLVLAACLVGGYFAWHHWARDAINDRHYQLLPENVQIPPAPPWIRSDIKGEVFRDGSLAEKSLLDRDSTPHVANAFEMHPWVAAVHRVSKQPPATMIVDLKYRRPVAWVEVPQGMFSESGAGVLPIDGEAVLLPQTDFSPADLDAFIRVGVADLTLCGPTGTPWGDPRVAGAAAIAELLGDNWKSLGLYRIEAQADYSQTNAPATIRFDLYTPKGKRLIWGSAPGHEPAIEPIASVKLRLLQEYVQRHGTLDQGAILGIDLRNPESLRVAQGRQSQPGAEQRFQ